MKEQIYQELVRKKENCISRPILNRSLTSVEKQIRDTLMDSTKTIEQIGKLTGIDQVQLIEHLSIMELEGIVKSIPGGRFGLKRTK